MTSSTNFPILFEMYRGDDVTFKVVVTDALDAAVDITDWDLKTTLKLDPYDLDDTDAVVQVNSGTLSGDDAELGIYYLLMPNAQTTLLSPGMYFMDVQVEKGALVATVLSGRVRVFPDVTRRTA